MYGCDLRGVAELLLHIERRLGFAGIFEMHVVTREQVRKMVQQAY